MSIDDNVKLTFQTEGFVILNNVFPYAQVEAIIKIIESVATDDGVFRKSKDLFAIRQALKTIPELQTLIFTNRLCKLINQFFTDNYFVVKSIYFDKPAASNWAVPYHQDLTISVDRTAEIEDYSCWTVKQNQYAVQPPLILLQNNFTIRIHLDNTDENNGALKVIPRSHQEGIIRTETVRQLSKNEQICKVKKVASCSCGPYYFTHLTEPQMEPGGVLFISNSAIANYLFLCSGQNT